MTCVLDHIALATSKQGDGWELFAGVLQGRWGQSASGPGLGYHQLQFSNNMKIRLLYPHRVGEDPFLQRFLDRHGPGVHHLAFRADPIENYVEAAANAGIRILNANLDDHEWRNAFLDPRQTQGILIHLGQELKPIRSLADAPSAHHHETSASFSRSCHPVHDLGEALELFVGILGGRIEARNRHSADLRWTGGRRLRLFQPVRLRRIGTAELRFELAAEVDTGIAPLASGLGIELDVSPAPAAASRDRARGHSHRL
jgi:methylmalonyl-CoA/ethylmalonyl-CoA epimerase